MDMRVVEFRDRDNEFASISSNKLLSTSTGD